MFNNQVNTVSSQDCSLNGTEWWQEFEARLGKGAGENCLKAYNWIAGLDATERSVQEVSDWHQRSQDLLVSLQRLEDPAYGVLFYSLQEYRATVCMLADTLKNLAHESFYVDWSMRNRVASVANAIRGAKDSLKETCALIDEIVGDDDEYEDMLVHVGRLLSSSDDATDSKKVAQEALKGLREWLGDTCSEDCRSWWFVYDSLQEVCHQVLRRLNEAMRQQRNQSPLLRKL